jgi:hypothetical protein
MSTDPISSRALRPGAGATRMHDRCSTSHAEDASAVDDRRAETHPADAGDEAAAVMHRDRGRLPESRSRL